MEARATVVMTVEQHWPGQSAVRCGASRGRGGAESLHARSREVGEKLPTGRRWHGTASVAWRSRQIEREGPRE